MRHPPGLLAPRAIIGHPQEVHVRMLAVLIVTSWLLFPNGAWSQDRSASQSCVVVFADDTELTVTGCHFHYTFGSGDKPLQPSSPKVIVAYWLKEKLTTDLLIETGTRLERGVTIVDDRSIPRSDIASITLLWRGETILEAVTIKVRSGEDIKLRGLIPAGRLLSSDPYVFEKRLYLKGRASIAGREGEFSKQLDRPLGSTPSETIREIRF
jgi:hypothetical protein